MKARMLMIYLESQPNMASKRMCGIKVLFGHLVICLTTIGLLAIKVKMKLRINLYA